MNEKAPWIGRNFSVFGIIQFFKLLSISTEFLNQSKYLGHWLFYKRQEKKRKNDNTIHSYPPRSCTQPPCTFFTPFKLFFHLSTPTKRMYPKHMSTRICEQSSSLYRHWKRGKVYPCLQNNRNARNRCPSTPVNRRGTGAEFVLFPNAACSYIRICLETVVYPVRQKNTGGGPCPGRSSMSDWYVAWGGGAGLRSKPVREYKKLQDAYPNGGRLMVPTESPIRVD